MFGESLSCRNRFGIHGHISFISRSTYSETEEQVRLVRRDQRPLFLCFLSPFRCNQNSNERGRYICPKSVYSHIRVFSLNNFLCGPAPQVVDVMRFILHPVLRVRGKVSREKADWLLAAIKLKCFEISDVLKFENIP